MLNNLSEKSERDEIAFEFLPNPSFPQLDVIKRGESLYLEQELSKDSASKLLGETLKNIKLSVKDNCIHFLDSFCRLDTTFPPDLCKKWQLSSIPNSTLSFFPSKSHTLALEEKISNKFEDRCMDKKSDFFTEMDNDLLSSELMNLTLTEFGNPTPQGLQPNHNKTSTNNNNASGFGNLTPIRSQNEIVIPQNKVLTENSLNNTSNSNLAQKRSNEKSQPQMRGNTPNTDRRLFGNSREETGSNVNQKLYKKKAKLVVPEKFEPVLEGLKKDSLEIVDFTGAELGDIGLQALCDLVRTSKNVKSLKLLKNKITNEGIPILLKALSENTSLISLNLAQNLLSDKVLDLFANFFQSNHSIKLLCLNQNNINVRNAKNKVADFKKLGITVSV